MRARRTPTHADIDAHWRMELDAPCIRGCAREPPDIALAARSTASCKCVKCSE